MNRQQRELTPDEASRIEDLIAQMTLAEKVSLMAGDTTWTTPSVERLGIPSVKVTDGPNGARGAGGLVGGSVTAAAFPAGISLASTWNTDLVHQIGKALAAEVKAKDAQVLLAPTVNIHRSPLNGRNFECYSEDPYLTARMAVAYITGVQSEGVAATVKHFVCNDSEFERNTISSDVDERTMREIYLPPFEAAVKEADSWGVMSSYNRINRIYASENRTTLIDILEDEWGFDGIVMSDWYGTHSTVAAANDGLDLEMPGPPIWRGQKLTDAVERGDVEIAAIDDHVRRLLRWMVRTDAFSAPPPSERTERNIDNPETRALVRRAAGEGIVLLKNVDNILPINLDRIQSIAVLGPNARTARIMGGGSANVNAHYAVTPYDAIVARVGDAADVRFEQGVSNDRRLPPIPSAQLRAGDDRGQHGFLIEYFSQPDLAEDPVHVSTITGSEQFWMGDVAPGVDVGRFSCRLTAVFTPDETGNHEFSLSGAGKTRLLVDGDVLIDNWQPPVPGGSSFDNARFDRTARISMEAGQKYWLEVDYSTESDGRFAGIRLGHHIPLSDDAIDRAAFLAADSDLAIVCVGLSGEWESEGFDRPDMDLVGRQNELVERVAAANPNTVVVLQTGSPVSMPWLESVEGVLEAWFAGQEAGNAIADVLFGDCTPSGKLTQTFPVRLEDNPAYVNYPGEKGHVLYGERVFVGYRWYDSTSIDPLFPFGFGLSYTEFAYGNVRLNSEEIGPEDTLSVTVDVTNIGGRRGDEVVQLYIHDREADVQRPEKELKAFTKVSLEPGETKSVTLTVDRTALAYWDIMQRAWVAEAGDFDALVGSSSRDIRAIAPFRLTGDVSFGAAPRLTRLSIDSSVKELLGSDAARDVLERHIPGFSADPRLEMAKNFSLRQVAAFAPGVFSDERLSAIDNELESVGV